MRPWVKDTLILVGAFAILLGGTFLYTQVWPPAVIVESSSMMHADSEVLYGRVGTIDPGDLVLVKRVTSPDDVATLVENNGGHYGKNGDVIIYFQAGDRSRVPIIHRAIAWVEPVAGGTFRARWDPHADCVGGATKDASDARWCVYGADGIAIPSVRLARFRPTFAGFVTKGDNPSSNTQTDPDMRISYDSTGRPSPVRIDWVEGKARGEVPWLGLIKLSLAGKPNEPNPPASWTHILSAYAPRDLWVCLALSLAALIGGPIAWDWWRAKRVARPK